MSELKHIVVIGTSAGGFNALTKLIATLPLELPAAVFIVMHLSRNSSAEIITEHLARHTSRPCRIPADQDPIEPGTIYLAPADHHLFLKPDKIRLTQGPHENRWRPSIDVLFRSAAAAFDSRVVGIVLSGMLDDGTSGMLAIKRSGGTCMVQEPVEAEYPDMPNNVINNVDVDYRVSILDMGYILDDIFSKPVKPSIPIPEDIKLEAQITERMVGSLDDLAKLGEHSNYTCPDCGGGLWLMKNEKNPRYRCHTGHVYTEKLLLEKQSEELEESLWVSIRMLEERRNLLAGMASREGDVGRSYAQQDHTAKVQELALHIERLKALLVSINKKAEDGQGYL